VDHLPALAALDQLDQVPWTDLEHAYGDAADIPDLIRAVRFGDAEVRGEALNSLLYSLDHQGVQRFEATLHAIRFLVGIVADPTAPGRGGVARLLAELAVGDTAWFLHDGFHPELQAAPDDCARPQASSVIEGAGMIVRGFPSIGAGHDMTAGLGLREIYEAVLAGAPVYLSALTDAGAAADDDLRGSIPFLLAWLTPRAAELAPALTALVTDDRSPAVRASAALGLSHAVKFEAALRGPALAVLTTAWTTAATEVERRCLALAISRFEEPAASADARAALHEALVAAVPAAMPDEDFAWQRIDSPPFLFCEAYLGGADDDHPSTLAAGLACLPQLTDPDDATDLALWLARLALPDPGDGVDDAVRVVIDALAAADPAWHFSDLGNLLGDRGYPAERAAFAALAES
jgi:hypothetical protein